MFCYRVIKTEKNNLKLLYAIKFCVTLEEGITDTYGKIQKEFGNDSVSHVQVVRWHKGFVNGEKRWKMNRILDTPPL
jgi:hypothetical protein